MFIIILFIVLSVLVVIFIMGTVLMRSAGCAVNDWADHITTAFPEVRLKRYIEMRGADSGPYPALNALPALWVTGRDQARITTAPAAGAVAMGV